jgi:acetyl esterase/lipase
MNYGFQVTMTPFKRVVLSVLMCMSCAWAESPTISTVAYGTALNQTMRVYTPAGMLATDTITPIVYIHGGGWNKGAYNDVTITPPTCPNADTVACALVESGYPVYDIGYTLVDWGIGGGNLMLSLTNDLMVSTKSYVFTSADINSSLMITKGIGWTLGSYTIVGAQNGWAILNSLPGTKATIGNHTASFNLVAAGTSFPRQWQDTSCALSWMTDNLGLNYPGNPNNIIMMGHSAGGHLVLLASLMKPATPGAPPTNCVSQNTNYTVSLIVAYSPPSDLVSLYTETSSSQEAIRKFLGCIPGTQNCNATIGAQASPITWLNLGQPPILIYSGAEDLDLPAENGAEVVTGSLALGVTTASQTILQGMSHPLDLYYFVPCSAGPIAPEPSPCGSAGQAFQDAFAYIQELQ